MKQANGFTLIEILIVILIISIIGGVAMLTISQNKNTQLEKTAKQITHLLNLAEQQAILTPAVLGVSFSENNLNTYQFREDATAEENPWQSFRNPILRSHAFTKDVTFKLILEDKNKLAQQLIIFTQSGDLSPFKLLIARDGNLPLYQVIGNADGSITYEKIENQDEA